jgi:antitoxin HigA-1
MDRIDSRRLCRPKHPGLVLATFIEPYGISQNSLARGMGVSPRRINEILQGKRAITADTAIGLAEMFGNGPLFWMRLQAQYDIAVARLLRQDRPEPPIKVFRSEPWDECAFDSTEDDGYLAALRRAAHAKGDLRVPRDPWLDDRDEPARSGSAKRGERARARHDSWLDDRDESGSSRWRDDRDESGSSGRRDDRDEPDS